MKINLFIGVDVSKETLDFHVIEKEKNLFHLCVDNNKKGIGEFYRELKKRTNVVQSEWLVCMEQTGIYTNPILKFNVASNVKTWIENGAAIKVYFSLARDKSDKIDAMRIALYAKEKLATARLYKENRFEIQKLKSLRKTRKQLLKVKQSLQVNLQEFKRFSSKELVATKEPYFKPAIKELTIQIAKIDAEIKEFIKSDTELSRLSKILKSVCGIGPVVSVALICVTEEFTKFENVKKLACHCGVAPFGKQSGTSIKSRKRVSQRADKSMKALLQMSAMSVIDTDPNMTAYYLKKQKEGKNNMSTLNAIRNKILNIAFACVKNNTLYDPNYKKQQYFKQDQKLHKKMNENLVNP